MDANEIIDKAIEVIEQQGWCQGDYVNDEGNVCMIGALRIAATNHRAAVNKVAEAIERETGLYYSVPEYNDYFAKSAEDAILMLKKAKTVGEA